MAISDSPAAETARRHFHWCLAAVILPVITLPLEWAAALAHRRDRGTSEDRRRSRRLFALAVADTIVAALVIGLVASGVWSWRTLIQRPSTAARPEPVRIGATLAANPQRPDEAQIMQIAIDSPAERAGLKAGDALIAIDGVPIRDLHGEDGSKSIPAPVLVYGRDDGGRIAINPISGASAIRWPFRWSSASCSPLSSAQCCSQSRKKSLLHPVRLIIVKGGNRTPNNRSGHVDTRSRPEPVRIGSP